MLLSLLKKVEYNNDKGLRHQWMAEMQHDEHEHNYKSY